MQPNKLLKALVCAFSVVALGHTQARVLFTPKAFKVTGVAENDVLNVRAGPTAQSKDLGDLQANAGPLEILAMDETGEWGRLNWQEGDGWVAMSYLEKISLPTLGNTSLPMDLKCFGTEPFWSMSFNSAETLRLSLHPDSDTRANVKSIVTSTNYIDYPVAVTAETDELHITVVIKPAACNDGMSDRNYGWEADVLTTRRDTTVLVSGCCSLLQ